MPSNTLPKTILLSGDPPMVEGRTSGAITPGSLVALNSSNRFVVHPTAAGMASPLFIKENSLIGKAIGDNVASGDQCQVYACQGGEQIYALVPAGAAAIVIGDYLESNGDGTLKKSTHATTSATTAAAWPVARALEALDNSGGGSVARLKVRVL